MEEIHWGKVLAALVTSGVIGLVMVALFAIRRLLSKLTHRILDKLEQR